MAVEIEYRALAIVNGVIDGRKSILKELVLLGEGKYSECKFTKYCSKKESELLAKKVKELLEEKKIILQHSSIDVLRKSIDEAIQVLS